jgi:hypothetical protein
MPGTVWLSYQFSGTHVAGVLIRYPLSDNLISAPVKRLLFVNIAAGSWSILAVKNRLPKNNLNT